MKRVPTTRRAAADPRRRFPERAGEQALTRLELLVIAAVLGVILLVQLPALAGHAGKGEAAVCRANLQRLIAAWQLYAQDYQGRMVPSYHGGFMATPTPYSASRSWAAGWLDWTTSTGNTNTLYLTDPRYAALADYGLREPALFRCPADTFVSKAFRAKGGNYRVRSYSANIAMGEGNAETGPWEASYFVHAVKLSDLAKPGPSASFVQVEEHPDSINDPAFFAPYMRRWTDLPASFHERACHFTFADGHVELHRWRDPDTYKPVILKFPSELAAVRTNDYNWVREHIPHR